MSHQSPFHKIQVKNRSEFENQTTTGASAQIFIDGKPLKGVSFFKFEVKPCKVAKITIEMYANVELEIDLDKYTPQQIAKAVDGYYTSMEELIGYYGEDSNFIIAEEDVV